MEENMIAKLTFSATQLDAVVRLLQRLPTEAPGWKPHGDNAPKAVPKGFELIQSRFAVGNRLALGDERLYGGPYFQQSIAILVPVAPSENVLEDRGAMHGNAAFVALLPPEGLLGWRVEALNVIIWPYNFNPLAYRRQLPPPLPHFRSFGITEAVERG